MKQITIGEKTYDLYFGFEFLRYIKEKYYQEMVVDGQIMILRANGLGSLIGQLEMCDPLAVIDVIKGATATAKQKPSNADIEQYITKLSNDNKYEKFVNDLRGTIEKEQLLNVIIKREKAN